MGWRYRKRIKILPGIHLNISKSGISTNIGVKGANVTFGKNGTYVNTGIPGTGLYRRDKVSGSGNKDNFEDVERINETERNQTVYGSHNNQKGFDDNTFYLSFKPSHYIFYFWPFFFSLAPLSCLLNDVNIIWGCLADAFFQIVLSMAIISNMAVDVETTAYNIKLIDDATISAIKREIKGHIIRCSLSIIIMIINLLPLLLMSKAFRNLLFGYEKANEGGWVAIPFTLLIVVLWIFVFFSEKNMIKPLKDIVTLKEGKSYNNDSISEISKASMTNRQPSSSQTNKLGDNEKQESSKQEIATLDSSNKESLFVSQPQEDLSLPFNPLNELNNYRFPSLHLLMNYESDIASINEEEISDNKNRLVKTLKNFSVDIEEIGCTFSPKFILYEIVLAPGVRASMMDGLEDDIALALHSQHVQIISPIPGKGRIGILVPKTNPDIVPMRSIFKSPLFMEQIMDLPCAIGKTISNENFIFDLAKAPHIIIAGPSGQGKSVLINVILTSLLFKKHPAEMKLVLMEPSGLELGPYSCLQNHFLASISGGHVVVSNSGQAVTTLKGLCKEMNHRFNLLRNAHAPNIKEYNKKIINRKLTPASEYKYMPYIVVVIDEYGFFIEEKGSEIEHPITQLAKYARAAGIHLILSTRQLTKETITDSIKDNIPARISFKMPDRKSSQLILDCDGAEQLSGYGDMLYSNGCSPIRIQGAFADTMEVDAVNSFISNQKGYQGPYELPNPYEEYEDDIDFIESY